MKKSIIGLLAITLTSTAAFADTRLFILSSNTTTKPHVDGTRHFIKAQMIEAGFEGVHVLNFLDSDLILPVQTSNVVLTAKKLGLLKELAEKNDVTISTCSAISGEVQCFATKQ